jgi:hypothetical protein
VLNIRIVLFNKGFKIDPFALTGCAATGCTNCNTSIGSAYLVERVLKTSHFLQAGSLAKWSASWRLSGWRFCARSPGGKQCIRDGI